MKSTALSLLLVLFVSACSHQTESSTSTPQFSVTASDIASASVQTDTNLPNSVTANQLPSLDVRLSGKAAADFQKFTQEHLNQRVQILVGGKVVAEPVIRATISSGELVMSFSTPEEAQTVIDSLTKK